MIKKLLISGAAIALLSACGVNSNDENTNQNAAPANDTETEQTNQATNNQADSQANEDEATENTTQTNTSETADITDPEVSLEEAVKIFNDAYPGVDIESIDLKSKSHLYYDIDGFDKTKEYEVEIDATTKELTEKEIETDQSDDQALDFSKIIDPSEAIKAANAESAAKGLTPTSWSLDVDDGIQKYQIEYDDGKNEVEIDIHAETGEVLEVDIDD